jgi:TP901 family phage tail tape measure protein
VADLRLGVKIGVQGGAQSAKEIKNLDDQVKRLQDQNAKAASTAKALGAAYNLSGAEVDQLINELRQLEGQTRSTAGEARKLDAVFQGLLQGFGQQLTQIGFEAFNQGIRAVESTIRGAVDAVSEFEAARAAAATLTNDVDGLVSALEGAQGRLNNQVTTNELLASSYDILSAGFTDAADAAVIAEQAARGAVAGFSDAGTVADALTTILNAYGKSSEDAAQVVDQLVKTQDLGKITIDQYAQTVGRAASIAATAGVSFEEFSASVAAATAAGVPAESAVSGTRQAILNLIKPTFDAKEVLASFGISNAQATLKSEGLLGVLRRLAEQDPTSKQLSKIFTDVDALSAVAPIAGENVGKLESALQQIGSASGTADRSIAKITDTLPNLAKQLRVAFLENLRLVGQSFEPTITAVLEFTQQVFTAASEGGAGLNLIAEAGRRLYEVLSNSPAAVAQLANAFTQIGTAISQGIADQLDRITTALETNPQLISDLATSFGNGAQQLIQFAGQLGQVAGSLAAVGASFAGAGASVFSSLAPTFMALNNVINGAVQALQPLLANTQLVEIAFQALLIRMVAIKAVGLANSFIGIATGLASLLKGALAATASLGALNVAQATGSKSALLLAQSLATSGASATTAALGFKAAAASAAAAAGPFVALAAAIATANLIKTTQELRFTNDELEAFANGVEVAASQGFNFANKLNSINDSIAAAGGKATAEQRKQLQEYVNLSKGQIEELKRQLTEVQSIEPKNDSQRNAQQNLTNQLQTTIGALEKQITEADGALTQASSGLGDKAGKAFSEGVKEGVGDGPQEAVKSALDGIKDEVDASLSDLELAAANTRATILEAGGDPAKLAQAEQQALKDRIDANKDFLAQLKELTPAEGEDAQKTADQIRQTELALANDRVALAQQVLEAKVKAAEDAAKAEVDRLTEARDTERESAQTEFDTQQEQARKRFGDEDRARQEAFNETQQNSREAFNESQRDADEAFQLRQQNAQKAFQKAQQAEAKRFQDQLNAERDRGNREFDALQKEVDRRAQLAEATGAERADLQRQFEEEDRRAKERRKIEQQVLNQRGSVLADQGDLLNLSPLEQARAAFEQSLQEKQVAFDEQQQIAQEAFEVRQRADQKIFEDQQKEDQRLFDKVQREDQKLFETSQQVLQEQFQSRQQAAEAAFNAQQRQLDEQSAQRQAAILESASRGIAPQVQARRDGGPVVAGQPYLVGEEGPELITPTRRGWVHTAGETAAIMARQPVMAIKPQSIAGVEAKLSELLQEVRQGRRVVAPTSFTLNTQNPLSDAVELQIKQVRALARGRVL